jgi:hypothetical protein
MSRKKWPSLGMALVMILGIMLAACESEPEVVKETVVVRDRR